ncbi:hypothetical protein PIB30_098778, partial [Stylosanthes scabra]|nr:hypothetical protein [Stylosanthes scabra]
MVSDKNEDGELADAASTATTTRDPSSAQDHHRNSKSVGLLLLLSPPSRANFVYIAKLTKQADRYEETVDVMKNVAKLNVELTIEEGNLLSVG